MRRARHVLMLAGALSAMFAGAVLGLPAAAGAAPDDIGIEDGSFGGGLSLPPTSSKPESKLWYADGRWWASMFDPLRGEHRIRKLVGATWLDAGTMLDPRVNTREDVLWDAANNKLYVASHSNTATSSGAGTGSDGKLFRYSFDPLTDTYAPDAGFPVNVGSPATETLVIDRDSTGRLWATWASGGKVYVNATSGADASWGTPFAVPGAATVDPDDIASVVAFGGDKIGVMWSNHLDARFHFAIHADGDADSAWSHESISVAPTSDDHINIKASFSGELFAAVKNGEHFRAPFTFLLKRSAGGTWTSTTFGLEPEHTRPIVLLDEGARQVHMIATCPQSSNNGQSGGDICEKVTSMSTPSFDTGNFGDPIIRDAGSPGMNNATSTKQGLAGQTGIVVMAGNDDTNVYWHSQRGLSGSLPALDADFTATPTSGTAPLDVQFTDASTGPATSWRWSFGDGATATTRNASHRYDSPGTYTVALTVGDASGRSDPETKTGLVVVGSSGGTSGTTGGGGTGTGGSGGSGDGVAGSGTPGSQLQLALTTRTTEIAYGASVLLAGKAAGDGAAGATLRLQASAFPFLTPLTDLFTGRAGRSGTRRFRIRNLRKSTRVVLTAGDGSQSNVITLRSAARVKVASVRRAGSRGVAVTGQVLPRTKQGVVDVQLRNRSGRFVHAARVKVGTAGRFRLVARAGVAQQLRIVARPRDGGAHVVGKSRVLRVPGR